MRKTKYISSFILIVIMAISIKISSCEQEDLDFYIDCFDCLESIPDSADLIVYLTLDEENNDSVPLILYIGDYEDNAEDYRFTAHDDTVYIYSEVGLSYSIKATYLLEEEPIVAIDGDKLRAADGEGECSPPCYVIRGGTLDLRLK